MRTQTRKGDMDMKKISVQETLIRETIIEVDDQVLQEGVR